MVHFPLKKQTSQPLVYGESTPLLQSPSNISYQSLPTVEKTQDPESAITSPQADLLQFSESNGEEKVQLQLKPEDYLEKPESPEERRQRIISLTVAFAVLGLIVIQSSLYWTSLWPYLKSIDPSVSEGFFGWILMTYALAGALASPVYGWWTNRIHGSKIPIMVGLALNVAGNALLAFVESFPVNSRRWVYMGARLVSGLGAGNRGALFAYVAMSSKESERNRVMSIRGAIGSSGLLLGPGIQAAMVPIGYPGFVSGEFRLNTYTAAAFFSLIFGLIGLVVMAVAFRDRWISVAETLNKETGKYEEMTMRSYNVITLCVCCYVRFALVFVIAFDNTVGSPLSMLMFGWSRSQAVGYNGIINVTMGILDIFSQLFVGNFVLKYVRERTVMFVGLLSSLCILLVVFPWPSLPPLIPETHQNLTDQITTSLGSMSLSPYSLSNSSINQLIHQSGLSFSTLSTTPNPCPYSWCSYTNRISLGQYLSSFLFFMGSVSLGYIPTATLFSKVLGPRPQGTWQGVFSFCGLMGMTLGPPIVSNMFQYAGLQAMYAIGMTVIGSAILLVVVCFKRLVSWSEMVKKESL